MKIIDKIINRWKEDWWKKEAENISREYQSKRNELQSRLDEEILEVHKSWKSRYEILSQEILSEEKKISLKQEEVAYRLKTLEDRNLELIKTDNEVKMQIKLLEAKASPNAVWLEAFTQGFSKAWDSMNPIMMENVYKTKKAIEERAIMDILNRNSNGNNKKIN